jgi:hypothetical protein
MNIQNLLKNVGYQVEVMLTPDEWIATFPERFEDEYSPDLEVSYNIEELIQNNIPKYCVCYYILAHIIKHCKKIHYAINLIRYYDEDDNTICEENVAHHMIDTLKEDEKNRLILLSDFIADVAVQGLTKELIKKTKKSGVYKDFILIYSIVKGEVDERV